MHDQMEKKTLVVLNDNVIHFFGETFTLKNVWVQVIVVVNKSPDMVG